MIASDVYYLTAPRISNVSETPTVNHLSQSHWMRNLGLDFAHHTCCFVGSFLLLPPHQQISRSIWRRFRSAADYVYAR